MDKCTAQDVLIDIIEDLSSLKYEVRFKYDRAIQRLIALLHALNEEETDK